MPKPAVDEPSMSELKGSVPELKSMAPSAFTWMSEGTPVVLLGV